MTGCCEPPAASAEEANWALLLRALITAEGSKAPKPFVSHLLIYCMLTTMYDEHVPYKDV